MMAPVGFGMRFSRLRILRASSKGQALLTWACAISYESTSSFGAAFFAVAAGAMGGVDARLLVIVVFVERTSFTIF